MAEQGDIEELYRTIGRFGRQLKAIRARHHPRARRH
jgi:predicted RNA-binding protein YlqC (UPF0109 family)